MLYPYLINAQGFSGKQLLIEHVTIINGKGKAPEKDMQVLIEGSRIISVSKKKPSVKAGAKIINATGKFMIPGLWDMHGHFNKIADQAVPLYLACGVTGVRDMGDGFDYVKKLKEDITSGKLTGPRIIFSGTIVESPQEVKRMREWATKSGDNDTAAAIWKGRIVVGDSLSAFQAIKSLSEKGVDFIKVRNYASKEAYGFIQQAAKKYHLTVSGHAPWIVDPIDASELSAGPSSFEHGFYPDNIDAKDPAYRSKLISTFIAHKTALVPTLIAYENRSVSIDSVQAVINDPTTIIDPRRKYISGELVNFWKAGFKDRAIEKRENLAQWRVVLKSLAAETGKLHKAGIWVMPGTDVSVTWVYPGFSLQDELILFVERVGMTPMEAIQSATIVPAKFLGIEKDLGTIETGKLADMVVLDANPLIDISNIKKIHAVIANGNYLNSTTLQKNLKSLERK
ncbi:MAG: amidohydrolase family protein [Panacibacter sp.]